MTGFTLYPDRLDRHSQARLITIILQAETTAPFYRPVTPRGQSMSVRMTNFGSLGWVTDAKGYRYQPTHPITGQPWPASPPDLLRLWADLADAATPPDACLVNYYDADSKMGLHQDRDEADFSVPVLSVSLGDTAVFRIGGADRRSPSRSVRLASGDVCILAGEARLAFHGIDRIVAGSSSLIPGGGRINLTLRRARPR